VALGSGRYVPTLFVNDLFSVSKAQYLTLFFVSSIHSEISESPSQFTKIMYVSVSYKLLTILSKLLLLKKTYWLDFYL